MSYAPPPEAASYYTDADRDHLAYICRRQTWAVHLIGPDEIVLREHPEMSDDNPANPELTWRTALKFATDHNAFAEILAGAGEPVTSKAVVLHNGEPWAPDPAREGTPGEYCELFDWAAREWFCNLCLEVITGNHCPTCAPMQFSGLRRLACDTPGEHPAVFMHATDLPDHGPVCFYCIAAAANADSRWSR